MKSIFGARLPERATIDSAGYDFYAPNTYVIHPHEYTVIDTGIILEDNDFYGVPPCALKIYPRSSYGFKYVEFMANTVGIIDKDYRDTIKVAITSDIEFTINKGDRFVQGVLEPFYTFANEVKPTKTRNGGIGSTGQ